MNSETTKRRTRERLSDQLDTLLNSITLDQLRVVLRELSSGPAPVAKTREKAIELIHGLSRSTEDVRRAAYTSESSQPFEHCFIAQLVSEPSPRALQQLIASAPGTHDILQIQFAYQTSDATVVTLEHDVPVREWVSEENGTVRRLRERPVRHPIVVRITKKQILITYPGVSQGDATKASQRVQYRDVVKLITGLLDQRFGLRTTHFPVRECINKLHEAKSGRLTLVRANTASGLGKLNVSSSVKETSIDKVIAQYLVRQIPTLSAKDLEEAAGRALRESSVESMLIFWIEERILTRVEFWDIGTELFVIWNRVDRNYNAIGSVVDLISQVSGEISSPSTAGVWDALASAMPGQIFLPNEFMSRFNATPDLIRRVMVDAIRAGIVEPVYAVSADDELLDEIGREWTTDLPSLRREFVCADGTVVNGADPNNINIAFRRTFPSEVRALPQ